ncbi:MAG: transcriptional regulator [Dialister invisus]|jgi:transcriptional regulator with XRE-family HTH domain|uniref:hypothetical protein n=1 Tax=Dialister invisus TaxID=218538 RepID=UPI0013FC98FA|nr:hypothetical protein [Dialister invisus]MUU09207.1 transcriptional regulator [Dialister invisus]
MDKLAFKYEAAKRGYSMRCIAKKLNIDPSTLSKKLCGHSEFTRSEIREYQAVLKLSPEKIFQIFFNK